MNTQGNYAGAGYQAPNNAFAPQRQQHTIALVALALGVLSWCGLGLIGAIPAWVLGARALREMGARPGVYAGEGAATAGMWLGIVNALCTAFAAVVVVAVLAFTGGLAGLVVWLAH